MSPLTSRRALVAGGLALLATPAWAARAAAMPSSPLRVGVLADLTGPLSRMGKQLQSGITSRAETLGGHGGAGMFELLVADSATGEADAIASLLEQGVRACRKR